MNFRRSRPVDPSSVETGMRDIIATLRSSGDNDTRAIIAAGTNTYLAAMIRFRSETHFNERDVDRLMTIWETLLDAGRAPAQVSDFAPKGAVEPIEEPQND